MAIEKRHKPQAEFNMSSLTDIIFLLLIFFMLTANLTNPNLMNVDLPESSSRTVAPVSIALSIKKDKTYYVGKEKMSFNQMTRELKRDISRNKKDKNYTVTILAEKGVPFEKVSEILTIAKTHDVKAILGTEPIKD